MDPTYRNQIRVPFPIDDCQVAMSTELSERPGSDTSWWAQTDGKRSTLKKTGRMILTLYKPVKETSDLLGPI